MGPRKYF
ncbi:hypothetical protein Patl1_26975 [Pistacia atlantica]|nr:hypothetical protein Patl1_26975 [Pistacia atlantica]